jgi:hypothetical protein
MQRTKDPSATQVSGSLTRTGHRHNTTIHCADIEKVAARPQGTFSGPCGDSDI